MNKRLIRTFQSAFVFLLVTSPLLWAHSDPLSTISEDDIIRHIQVLASDSLEGRRSGEPGSAKAAAYIESEFKKIGLLPGGVNGTYRQPFDVVAASELGEKNYLKVDGKELPIREKWMPLSYTQTGEAKGELVFAGFGITASDFGYDDYAGLDVKGKIVLVMKFGPEGEDRQNRYNRFFPVRYKAMNAREHGALGVLVAATEDTFKYDAVSRLRHDWAPGDAGILVAGIDLAAANSIIEKGGKGTLDKIAIDIAHRSKPNSFELSVEMEFATSVKKRLTKTDNVIGFLPGNDPKVGSEVVVIGAHYDHLGKGGPESLSPKEEGEVHHGADDNASGTAGLLELAEAFASFKPFLKRSVLFIAFSGEEEGTLGSSFFVKNPTVPFEKITSMVNMDMIGRMKDSTIIIQGAGTSPIWKELVGQANKRTGLKIKFTDDGYGPSDHSPFYAKEKPVLFFFSGTHADYHKPSDTWEKINADGERLVLRLAYHTIDKIQGLDVPPTYVRTKGDSVRMGAGSGELRAYLGTIPDYSEELVGVKLSGVREGSPAEKAGIQGGDVIVRFGTKEIRNIYDYTYALGAHKPGETVEIGLTRDGKSLTVSVLLERRR
ncbi:MAG: M20/M25/M40 family metallo-hydrolase [candidate division Zixibacteria bacterium]|nr:M20/M25/M40 family metallo-hydrolase [candidate division Zixibacteria bacterium]MCI0596427.1 M20/M25/M40 family metallo-hydrolase [candidate division Zixibacteria bacterium]